MLNKSLCGKDPCPSVCSRVCHCPAGQARVHWLWLLRRGYRVSDTPIPWMRRRESKPRDPTKQFCPTHDYETSKAPYSRNTRHLLNPLFISAILLIIGITLFIGYLVNGNNLVGHVEPDPGPAPQYPWMFNK